MAPSPVPATVSRGLPIARVRDVFSPEEVDQRLRRLRAHVLTQRFLHRSGC